MNKEDMIKIGIAAFVVIILIVIVVIVTRKKDNYEYPKGRVYNLPSGAPGARVPGSGGVNIPTSTSVALLADENGNINTNAALPIGAIIMWGGTSIPFGWGLCNGTVYTGKTTNIPSPDLTGRFVVGAGQSSSALIVTTQYGIGDMGGEEFHQLTIEEMPSHNHGVQPGWNLGHGGGNYNTAVPGGQNTGGDPANKNETLPHNNMPPYYALAYIIKYM